MTTTAPSLTWLQKIMGPPAPGTTPPPPITDIAMIPERRKAISLDALNRNLPEIAELHEDVLIREREDYNLTAEIYVPKGDGPFPVILYMHGGANCVWSPRDVRRIGVPLAAAGHVVVNLDYGLAPEHPFPCGVEDTIYAARWAALNAGQYGGREGAIAVGGDSAGAAHACSAVTFLDAVANGVDLSPTPIDEGDLANTEVKFSAGFLHCGGFNIRARMSEGDTTPGTTEVMGCLAYLGPHFLAKQLDPLASPFFAQNLSAMPPSYLSCGAADPLLPQTLALTQKFADAGVDVTTSIVPNLDHEFLLSDPDQPTVATEWRHLLEWLSTKTRQASA